MDLQMGGSAGSRRRIVIGLDHRLGPIQRKCGQAHDSEVQQGFDLLWVLSVSGRSCERGRKGAHRSSNQPVKADGHSSSE
jgi:hypothetical protein